MQNIYLIRHGEKELTPPNPGLTEKGFHQAISTGKYLRKLNELLIISSPMHRTIQTATLIAKQLAADFTCSEQLKERINFGYNPTQTKDEFLRDWELTTKNRAYKPNYGESSIQTGNRMKKYILNLPKNPKNIILITHGGAIADFLRTTFGDKIIFPKLFNPEKQQEFHVEHCSITHLLKNKKEINIEKINFVDHLKK